MSESYYRVSDDFQTYLKPLCVDFTAHMILLLCRCFSLWSSSDAWSHTLATSFLVVLVTDGSASVVGVLCLNTILTAFI